MTDSVPPIPPPTATHLQNLHRVFSTGKNVRPTANELVKLIEYIWRLEQEAASLLRQRIADLEASLAAKWISVDERLPETEGDVLVWTNIGLRLGWLKQDDRANDRWRPLGDFDACRVILWQPLPAPPDEKENDDQTKK